MNNTKPGSSLYLPLLLLLLGIGLLPAQGQSKTTPKRPLMIKAESITLPLFKVEAVSFPEAVRQLSAASKQHDPANEGFNFLLTPGVETNAHKTISLELKNVSVAAAAERLAKSVGAFVQARDYALVFSPITHLGAVDLVPGKQALFSLGAGQSCSVVGKSLPDGLHLKLKILSTNSEGQAITQSMSEVTTLPGKRCEVLLEGAMITLIPSIKTQ